MKAAAPASRTVRSIWSLSRGCNGFYLSFSLMMKNEQTNNGYPEDPYEGLLDSGPENGLAPEGEALDLFWYFKDEADLNPNTPRIHKLLQEVSSIVLDRIETYKRYELEALHFATTKELLMWIRTDDDRLDWAWSNRTYRRMLEKTN